MKPKLRRRVLRNLKEGIIHAEHLYDAVRDAEDEDDRESVLSELISIAYHIHVCMDLIRDDLRT